MSTKNHRLTGTSTSTSPTLTPHACRLTTPMPHIHLPYPPRTIPHDNTTTITTTIPRQQSKDNQKTIKRKHPKAKHREQKKASIVSNNLFHFIPPSIPLLVSLLTILPHATSLILSPILPQTLQYTPILPLLSPPLSSLLSLSLLPSLSVCHCLYSLSHNKTDS